MNDGTNKIVQLGGQSVTATVTAGTNAQGQGPLTRNLNVVNTTTANPSGVTLPTALLGNSVYVFNRGTNPINVYPATGAQIDALGTNVSIQIAVGGWLQFNATSTTQWYSSFSASVLLSANNAFTGANTFTNTTGQTFRQAATQDGILLRGRAGGTGSFTLEIVPATLSANSTFTIPTGTQTAATQERTNIFTALNTFSSSSGVAIYAGSSPTDGLTLKGNATGTGAFRTTIQPASLSASRTFTIPNVDGTAITTGDSNTVTNAILSQVATSTFKGRVTAATGNVEDLTGTQATTLLDPFTSTLKGLAPASGGGTTNFLRADGTWAAPAGGGGGGVSYGQILATQYGAAMP